VNRVPSALLRFAADCLQPEVVGGSGAAPPAGTVASSAEATFRKLRDVLARVIGGLGFEALLRRSIALARSANETRLPSDDGTDLATALDELRAQLGAAAADLFATTVFAHVVWLLATFIGTRLTMRLLGEAWPALMLRDGDLVAGEEEA
jgi:hypothetical protein